MVWTWSRPYCLCHRPYTLAHTKGFGSHILHIYVCLLLCFMLVLASLVLGFATLDALHGRVVTSNAHEALFGCNHLGCITMMLVASCIPFRFSALCDDMLAMLVCATHWLYMHIYTLAYMSMHEYCLLASMLSILQHNEVMDIKSKPKFVPHEHHLLFLFFFVCFFTCLLTFLLCLPCLSRSSVFMPLHELFASFHSITCLLVSCLCICT